MLLLPWSFVLSGLVTGRHKPGSMPAVRVAVVSQDEKGAAVLSLMDEHLDEVKEPMPGRVAMQELRLFGAEGVASEPPYTRANRLCSCLLFLGPRLRCRAQ